MADWRDPRLRINLVPRTFAGLYHLRGVRTTSRPEIGKLLVIREK